MPAPFRHATLPCPRCRTTELTTGDLGHCGQCKGTWIASETLAEHVGTMQANIDPKLVWRVEEGRAGLACAVCREVMEAARLFGLPVDRCHAHGVWFDKDLLGEVLRRSALHVEPRPPADARRSDDPSVAWAAAEVGGQVAIEGAVVAAEAGGGLVEGVLDVLGGIFSAIDL